MRRIARTVGVASLVVVLVGVAGGTATAERKPAPVLTPFEAGAPGVTIGIPEGWKAFDVTVTSQQDVQRELAGAKAKDPAQLASIVPVLTAQGGLLYAVDTVRRAKLNQNLNVLRNPLLDRTIDGFETDLLSPFRNLGEKIPKIEHVTIAGLDARQATRRVKYNGARVLLRQLIVVVGDHYYQFTYSLRPNAAGRRLAAALNASIAVA